MAKTNSESSLQGRRILIADDEFLIAITIEETLHDAGAEIVNAATLSEAMNGATTEPLSAALLDVRIGRQTTESVADILTSRAIPFVFYTGQDLPNSMRQKFPDAPVLMKPVRQETFVEALLKVIG